MAISLNEFRVLFGGVDAGTGVLYFGDEYIEAVFDGTQLFEFFQNCLRYLEMNLVGAVIVGGVGEKGDILKKPDRLNEAYELGNRLAGELA